MTRLILPARQRIFLLLPFLLLVGVFLLLPLGAGFGLSFTSYKPFTLTPVQFTGLVNYSSLLANEVFRAAISNVLLLTALLVSLEMGAGVAIALVVRPIVSQYRWLPVLLLIPWLVSPAASGVMWHYLLSERSGFINFALAALHLPRAGNLLSTGRSAFTMLILTEAWRKVPVVIYLVLPALQAIPADRWEQGRLDGLNFLAQFRHIMLPGCRTLLFSLAMLLIGDTLGISESVYFLTGGGPGTATITPGLLSFTASSVVMNWSRSATTGWLIAAAVLLAGTGYMFVMRRQET